MITLVDNLAVVHQVQATDWMNGIPEIAVDATISNSLRYLYCFYSVDPESLISVDEPQVAVRSKPIDCLLDRYRRC